MNTRPKTTAMLTALSAVATVSAAGTSARAQSSPNASPSSAPAQIEEIVVTAQKRSQNLQDVPIAITAFSAPRLRSSGVNSSQDLTIVTPSLTMASAAGYFQPRIRGVGTTAEGPGIENPVATYVDGVYIASAPASLFSFNNIDRIEVLKGPQGTLFGRNATGGVISVITADPNLTPSGKFEVGYGNYNTATGNLYLSSGFGDSVAADIAVQATHQGDGYGKDVATGRDTNALEHDISARSKIVVNPTATTKLRLTFDYFDVRGSIPSLRAVDTPLVGPPTHGSPWDSNNNEPTLNHSQGGGVSLNIKQDLGFAAFTNITAYRQSHFYTQFDYDFTPTPALAIFIDQADHQFSQELQLASKADSKVTWLAGFYYFNATGEYDPVTNRFGGPLLAFQPLSTDVITGTAGTLSYAGFAQVTVPLGNATNFTAGLRYTDEQRSIRGEEFGFLPGGIPTGLFRPPINEKATFSKPTWRLALGHKIGDVLLYVSDNRGFKSGGFNPEVQTLPMYQPETLDAYELGAKATFLSNRLRLNPALFYYDYKNLQVPFYTNQGTIGVVNGPSATLYGADVDAEFVVTPDLRFFGGFTYLHARFGTYLNAPFNIPLPAGNNQTTGDATGHQLPFTPEWNGSIGADYRLSIGNFGNLEFNVVENHNSGFYTEVDNLRRQNAFDMVNGSITLTPLGKDLRLRLWAKNLLDKAVVLTLAADTLATGASYQPPRTFGFSIGYTF